MPACWNRKKSSAVDLWKCAIQVTGGKPLFVELESHQENRVRQWPYISVAMSNRELALIDSISSDGLLLNRQILKPARWECGLNKADQLTYLAVVRNAIFDGCESSLDAAIRLEELYPKAFHILSKGNLREKLRDKQSEIRERVAAGQKPCRRRARQKAARSAHA